MKMNLNQTANPKGSKTVYTYQVLSIRELERHLKQMRALSLVKNGGKVNPLDCFISRGKLADERFNSSSGERQVSLCSPVMLEQI